MYTCFICGAERMFAGSPTKAGWESFYNETTQTWEYRCNECREKSYGAS